MSDLKRFSAVYLAAGQARRMTFEATDLVDARQQAERWGVGVEGEAVDAGPVRQTLPEAYDLKTTCALLGGISRMTAYRMTLDGRLDRVPNIRRTLITRRSIERCAAGRS